MLSRQDISHVSSLAFTEQRTEGTSEGVSLPYFLTEFILREQVSLPVVTWALNQSLSSSQKAMCPLLTMFIYTFVCF